MHPRDMTPVELAEVTDQIGEALSGSCHKFKRTLNHDPAAQATTTTAPAPANSHLSEPIELITASMTTADKPTPPTPPAPQPDKGGTRGG